MNGDRLLGAASALVIATGNPSKLREYRALLHGKGLSLVPFAAGVEEEGESYYANALSKASAACHATGLPALGEDAGIEVLALGGRPGIGSARFGGTPWQRTARLLELLDDVPRPWRARFVCSLVLVIPGQPSMAFYGIREGEVVPEWRGELAFGYDPVFLVPEADKTFGEMTVEEKNRWSHRGAAVRSMLAFG